MYPSREYNSRLVMAQFSGYSHFNDLTIFLTRQFFGNLAIFLNCKTNIIERFFHRRALRAATGQAGATDAETLFRSMKHDAIFCHGAIVHRIRRGKAGIPGTIAWRSPYERNKGQSRNFSSLLSMTRLVEPLVRPKNIRRKTGLRIA
jgi:hypothetical protein